MKMNEIERTQPQIKFWQARTDVVTGSFISVAQADTKRQVIGRNKDIHWSDRMPNRRNTGPMNSWSMACIGR